MLQIKNTTGSDISIDNIVQIDISTPDVNDGFILSGQTLNLLNSFRIHSVLNHEEIIDGISSGDLVFVIGGVEQTMQQSIDFWDLGMTAWAFTTQPTSLSYLKDLPQFQEAVRDALENLTGADRLDSTAIKTI